MKGYIDIGKSKTKYRKANIKNKSTGYNKITEIDTNQNKARQKAAKRARKANRRKS